MRLPPYRYVPGLHPHPFRHEGGHAYTDGGAPPVEPWDWRGPWRSDDRVLHARDLFDHRYLWEAHELWEGLWHQVPADAPLRGWLQGLIQVAAALLKLHMGHARAARTLAGRADARLSAAQVAWGADCRGVDVARLRSELDAALVGGPWPRLSSPGAA
jgi:hypothetical protein